MLDFKPVKFEDTEVLKKYYSQCNYGASEYSVGTQLMWGIKHKTLWAESHGCLICKDIFNKKTFFDYPVPLGDGDVDAALDEIVGLKDVKHYIRSIIALLKIQKERRNDWYIPTTCPCYD